MPDLSHVMPNPVIVPVLWGHDYVANPETTKLVERLINDLVTGPFMNGMAQYGVRRGTVATPVIIDDQNPPSTIVYYDKNNKLVDQITKKLISWIDEKKLSPPPNNNLNQLYLIIPPSQTTFEMYNGASDPIGNGIQGYHNTGTTNPGPPPTYYWAIVKTNDCGPPSAGQTFVNNFAQKVAHELAEQFVDRNGTFEEIGDPCLNNSDTYRGWSIQKIWSDWDNTCIKGYQPPPMPRGFQGVDDYRRIFVLKTDGTLWLEEAPFGTAPPARKKVDEPVYTFQAMDENSVFVLRTDGTLWLETGPFGTSQPSRVQVDSGVQSFKAITTDAVYVLGNDQKLWLEQGPWRSVPPSRQQVDANVKAFEAFNTGSLYILSTDGNLWLAQGPFGNVPPKRQLGASKVRGIVGLARSQMLWVLGSDLVLNSYQVPVSLGPWPSPQLVANGVLAFQPVNPDGGFYLTTANELIYYQGLTTPDGSGRLTIDTDVMEFAATDPAHVLALRTDGSLWFEEPHGLDPTKRTLVDKTVA